MQDELSCELAGEQSPHDPAQAVLGLLLSRHPGLVAFEELVRELVDATERRVLSEVRVRDGIADLVGEGLAYRVDERFVMASQAAVRAGELIE